MKGIKAVFIKQLMDTLKNKALLIHFLMFPLFTIVLENTIKLEQMPEHFFTKLFAVMFVGMSPLICMASIISEEKETGTLRALVMSGVKPGCYLAGVGVYVWIFCMAGAVAFMLSGEFRGSSGVVFMAVMAAGILISMLIGAAIGMFCPSQMSATSVTTMVMVVLAFLPMISMFNEKVGKISEFTYSQQVSNIINGFSLDMKSSLIFAANIIISVALFAVAYGRKGLE